MPLPIETIQVLYEGYQKAKAAAVDNPGAKEAAAACLRAVVTGYDNDDIDQLGTYAEGLDGDYALLFGSANVLKGVTRGVRYSIETCIDSFSIVDEKAKLRLPFVEEGADFWSRDLLKVLDAKSAEAVDNFCDQFGDEAWAPVGPLAAPVAA